MSRRLSPNISPKSPPAFNLLGHTFVTPAARHQSVLVIFQRNISTLDKLGVLKVRAAAEGQAETPQHERHRRLLNKLFGLARNQICEQINVQRIARLSMLRRLQVPPPIRHLHA